MFADRDLLPKTVLLLIGGIVVMAGIGFGVMRFYTTNRVLTDTDLQELATLPFDKSRMMQKTFLVGRHRGTSVRIQYPCGDVCPDYTIKSIYYDVDPGACPIAQGEVLTVGVPAAASVVLQQFCFPRILHVQGVATSTPAVPFGLGLAS